MRHRVDHRKLGRTQAHRKAMLSNMVMSLFDKHRIMTTGPKAKEARRKAEQLITRAKKGYAAFQEHLSLKEAGKEAEAKQMQAEALAHWRQAGRVIKKQSTLKKLFDEIAPTYMDRNGGYTRILNLQHRLGDNAKTVLLELVGKEEEAVAEEPKAKAKSKSKAKAKPKDKAAGGKKEAADKKEPVEKKTAAPKKSKGKPNVKAAPGKKARTGKAHTGGE